WRWPQRNLEGNAIDFFVQVSPNELPRRHAPNHWTLNPVAYDSSPADHPKTSKMQPCDGSVVSGPRDYGPKTERSKHLLQATLRRVLLLFSLLAAAFFAGFKPSRISTARR